VEGRDFDALARRVAAGTGRRAVLRHLLAGAAVALGVGAPAAGLLRTSGGAAAVCRPGGDVCRKDGDCCSGDCLGPDATGRARCACARGTSPCGTACCAAGQVCVNSACRTSTPTATATPTPTPSPTATPVVCPACSIADGSGGCVRTQEPLNGNCPCGFVEEDDQCVKDGCRDCFQNVGGICVPEPPGIAPNGPCACGFREVGGICVPK
jgi:hypothetical protein